MTSLTWVPVLLQGWHPLLCTVPCPVCHSTVPGGPSSDAPAWWPGSGSPYGLVDLLPTVRTGSPNQITIVAGTRWSTA